MSLKNLNQKFADIPYSSLHEYQFAVDLMNGNYVAFPEDDNRRVVLQAENMAWPPLETLIAMERLFVIDKHGAGNAIYCFSLDGKLIWKHQTNPHMSLRPEDSWAGIYFDVNDHRMHAVSGHGFNFPIVNHDTGEMGTPIWTK